MNDKWNPHTHAEVLLLNVKRQWNGWNLLTDECEWNLMVGESGFKLQTRSNKKRKTNQCEKTVFLQIMIWDQGFNGSVI